MNKSAFTNIALLAMTFLGWFFGLDGIKTIGIFGFSGSITNWLAVHMLFERVPFVYQSGVIANNFEEFKESIKDTMMANFFRQSDIDSASDVEQIVGAESINIDSMFSYFKEAVVESSFGKVLPMFGGMAILEELKPAFVSKMKLFITESSAKLSGGENRSELLQMRIRKIVEKKTQEITEHEVKDMISSVIRTHLQWLVVWGGFFGGLIGFIFNLI